VLNQPADHHSGLMPRGQAAQALPVLTPSGNESIRYFLTGVGLMHRQAMTLTWEGYLVA